MTLDLNTAKRDEIAGEIRDRVGRKEISVYMSGLAHRGIHRQSDLSKADWQDMYRHFQQLGMLGASDDIDAPEPATTKEPVPVQCPQPMKPRPEKTPDLDTALAGLDMMLSDKAMEPIKAGIAALRDQASQAEQRAKDLESAPAQVVHVNAAPVPSGTHVTQSTGKQNAGNLFPRSKTLTNRNIMIDVCDCPDAPRIDPNYLWPKETPDMLAALSLGMNVLIYGDRGTGKSSWSRNIAALTKRPHFQIGFQDETSSADLFGMMGPDASGGMSWVPGDLLIAMQTPYAIIDLAEVGIGRAELTAQLFSILEENDRTIYVGGTRYHVHPTVWFVGTSNDDGTGEQAHRFHGVKPMNPALVSRFAMRVGFELPDQTRLAKMLAKQADIPLPAAVHLAKLEKQLEAGVRAGNCEATPGFRALIGWAGLVKTGTPINDAFSFAVLNSNPSDDQAYWGQEYAANFDQSAFLKALNAAPGTPADQDDDPEEIEPRTRAGFSEL